MSEQAVLQGETAAPDAPRFEFPAETSELLRSCVHCGLCLGACPTYRENGDENDSPRGRLYLMKGLAYGKIEPAPAVQRHLDLCLDCRACETACPSGVHYGRILETTREYLNEAAPPPWHVKFLRKLLFEHLFARPVLLSMATSLMRFQQKSGLRRFLHSAGVMKLLPPRLRLMEAMQPPLDEPPFRSGAPAVFPAGGGVPRMKVALFSGCVMDLMMGEIHRATVKVLQAYGIEVHTVHAQHCCGALMFHAGEAETGRALAKRNIEAFSGLGVDAIVNNSAGCGAVLKEYGEWLPGDERAHAFAKKNKDVSEILAGLEPVRPYKRISATVCYDAPCHLLHAQKISAQPVELIKRIPGVAWIELPDANFCCGAAGVYNLTQPAMSRAVLRRKVEAIRSTGAEIVLTGNPGCLLQIRQGCKEMGLSCEVLHPMELLARAL